MPGSTLALPVFIVNFKSYIWGSNAVRLARKMEKIAQETNVHLCAIPQIIDVYRLAMETKVPLFSPHLDSLTPGRGTGRILPEAVGEAGAVGVLLNHAENRLPLDVISETVRRAREVGLLSIIAATSPEEAEIIAALRPEVILPESPARIGTLKSIGRDSNFVIQSIKKIKSVDPSILVVFGSGISSGRDVAELVKLGAEGMGASRAIFEAKDPVGMLKEMVKALEYTWKERR